MSAISHSPAGLPEGRTGRWLALVITLMVLAALWVGLAVPVIGWYQDRAERLGQRGSVAQRMEMLAQALPQLRQQAAMLTAGAATAGAAPSTILTGESDAVAAAQLQQMVQDMATRAGAEVASAETLPVVPVGAYRQIGLRVTLNARWAVLIRLLQAISAGSPRMLVDDLQVHSARVLAQAPDPAMSAGFTVLAYRAEGAPTKNATSAPANLTRASMPVEVSGAVRFNTSMDGSSAR